MQVCVHASAMLCNCLVPKVHERFPHVLVLKLFNQKLLVLLLLVLASLQVHLLNLLATEVDLLLDEVGLDRLQLTFAHSFLSQGIFLFEKGLHSAPFLLSLQQVALDLLFLNPSFLDVVVAAGLPFLIECLLALGNFSPLLDILLEGVHVLRVLLVCLVLQETLAFGVQVLVAA